MASFGDEMDESLNDFQPAAVDLNNGDFFEVDSNETPANYDNYASYGIEQEQSFNYDAPITQEPSYSYEEPISAPVPEPIATPAPPAPVFAPAPVPVIEEDNELTKFLAKYEQEIAEKAKEQEKVALECKEKAKTDMQKFLTERSRIKESKQQANRIQEAATLEKLAHDLEHENPWERVVSLVDLETNRKSKLAALAAKKDSKNKEEPPKAKKEKEDEEDLSRMRQLFVQLKATPLEKTRAASVSAH